MLFREPPLQLQLLSFLDAQVNVFKHYHGFISGDLVPFSLLDNPIVSYGDSVMDPRPLSKNLKAILATNLDSNPFFQRFQCIAERESSQTGLAVVPATIVDSILHQNIARAPLRTVIASKFISHVLGLLTDERPLAGSQAPRHNTIFEMGSLNLRNKLVERGSSSSASLAPLKVRADGLPNSANGNQASRSPSQLISHELAFFPFLFPFGLGAYDGAITLCKYLCTRMRCFLLIFTLYKLYLLMMYQIRQAVVLSNTFKQLEREIF